jgi:glycosyltransferase involved in cell wall biosynthesis
MDKPFVSVVMPAYNGERFLRESLDSVLAQTYPNLEIVVVDDGSTDGTPGLLLSYEERLVVVTQQNEGVAKARNAGIHRAGGALIAFIDQDDLWAPTKIEKQVALLEEDERVGLVHTATAYFDNATQSFRQPLCESCHPESAVGDCFERLLLGNTLTQSSVMVRKTVLEEVGLFDPLSAKNSCQDYDLWLRVARVCRFGYLPEKLTTFRLHPDQGTWDRRTILTDELNVLRRAVGLQDDFPEHLRRRFADLYEELAIAHLDAFDRVAAQAFAGKAYRLKRTRRRAVLWTACLLPGPLLFPLRRLRDRLLRRQGNHVE